MQKKLVLDTLQAPPKFSINQEVVWAFVEARDRGTIVSYVWFNQTIAVRT